MNITILANTVSESAEQWWSTGIGQTVRGLLVLGGIIMTFRAVAAFVKESSQGRISRAFSASAGSLILAVFMFKPTLATTLLELFSSLFDGFLTDTRDEVTNKSINVTS